MKTTHHATSEAPATALSALILLATAASALQPTQMVGGPDRGPDEGRGAVRPAHHPRRHRDRRHRGASHRADGHHHRGQPHRRRGRRRRPPPADRRGPPPRAHHRRQPGRDRTRDRCHRHVRPAWLRGPPPPHRRRPQGARSRVHVQAVDVARDHDRPRRRLRPLRLDDRGEGAQRGERDRGPPHVGLSLHRRGWRGMGPPGRHPGERTRLGALREGNGR